jgi:hypothetical protein
MTNHKDIQTKAVSGKHHIKGKPAHAIVLCHATELVAGSMTGAYLAKVKPDIQAVPVEMWHRGAQVFTADITMDAKPAAA